MAQLRLPSHLSMVYVDPGLHRLGVGRRLWQGLVRALPQRPEIVTVRSSRFAVDFYKALGFRLTGNTDSEGGIISYPMTLQLEPAKHA
jgi:ribosomal protein S18 acetylase RimI-like enzyme